MVPDRPLSNGSRWLLSREPHTGGSPLSGGRFKRQSAAIQLE